MGFEKTSSNEGIMTVIKALNNNMVLVRDSDGVEKICQGKGIGFQKRSGDKIARSQVERFGIKMQEDEAAFLAYHFVNAELGSLPNCSPSSMAKLIGSVLDTVALEGKPFEYHVTEGQKVKKGDLLLTADLKMITDAGYKIHTPVLVTNSDDYVSVKIAEATNISSGDPLMTIC